MEAYELKITAHPKAVVQDREADEFTTKNHFLPKPLLMRILKKIERLIS